jgi:WD40 repeat protein
MMHHCVFALAVGLFFAGVVSANGWHVVSKQAVQKIEDAEKGQDPLILKGHKDVVRSVSFSPDGKRIASASFDQSVKVWDAETGKELPTLKGHFWEVWGVAFSPDGKRLVSGGGDWAVKVWDVSKGR